MLWVRSGSGAQPTSVLMLTNDLVGMTRPPIFCLPRLLEGEGFRTLHKSVIEWLEDGPELAAEDAVEKALEAAQELYPCKQVDHPEP